jgi:hypothetical protein
MRPNIAYLRIAVTALSLTACVLLIALWARSYTWVEAVRTISTNGGVIQLVSIPGTLGVGLFKSAEPWSFFRMSTSQWRGVVTKSDSSQLQIRGGRVRNQTVDQVFLPYWVLIILSTVSSVFPWIQSPHRFSLRTLLIATTLVAVVLGIVVAAR